MKLPEFTASKRMSLNMTSSRATADRSAEFQAKGALTGKINQFSEALEQKRRAANVQTFKRDENISTMEDWTDAKNIINKSKRLDGSFDFKLAQDYDTEKRH